MKANDYLTETAAARLPRRPEPSERHTGARLAGIFVRKERWGLSLRGWAACLVLAAVALAVLAVTVFPFLAITDRLQTDVLVVEGWIPSYALHAAVQEFESGNYKRVFTTGGPTPGSGSYINDFNTGASVAAELLRSDGMAKELVTMVPSRVMARNRTYGSALALREWFRANDTTVTSINVLTEAPHARRTRLLYQAALGKDVRVGVIAIHSPDYDEGQWWCYSEGVRDVIGEAIAYAYARLSLLFN